MSLPHTSALLDRALLLGELGRYEDAEQVLRDLVSLDPGNALPYAQLALVLSDLERDREAEDRAREAIALDPDLPIAHAALARGLAGQERLREAVAVIREAIRLDPDDHLDHEFLAACLYDLGDRPGARKSAQRALALAPESATAHGLLALTSSDPDVSQAAAVAALRTDPGSSAAHALVGHAHLARGRARQAVAGFEEALRLDPENEYARAGLAAARKAARPLLGAALIIGLWLGIRALLVLGALVNGAFLGAALALLLVGIVWALRQRPRDGAIPPSMGERALQRLRERR